MRRYTRGFTLMELIIVVVIVGILTAIAYPNYQQFVARAKRNEAKAALLKIATNEEKYYLQNSNFTLDMTRLSFSTDPFVTDSGTYSVTVTAADASNFLAVATYQNTDSEAGKCLTFKIDGRGTKSSAPDTDCWARSR